MLVLGLVALTATNYGLGMMDRMIKVVSACIVCAALATACRSGSTPKPPAKTTAKPTLAWLLPQASASNVTALFRTALAGIIGDQYNATTETIELTPDQRTLTVTGLVVVSEGVTVRIDSLVVTALARRSAQVVASLADAGHKRRLTATIHATPEGLSVVFPAGDGPGLQKVPGLRDAVGLPLEGHINAEIQLKIPKRTERHDSNDPTP